MKLLPIIFLVLRFLTLAPLANATGAHELAYVSQDNTAAHDLSATSEDDSEERDDNEAEDNSSCLEDDAIWAVHGSQHFSFKAYYVSQRLEFESQSIAPPNQYLGSVFRPPIHSI